MATQDTNYLKYVSMLSKMDRSVSSLTGPQSSTMVRVKEAGFLFHAFGVLTHPFVAPAYVLHTGVSRLGYQQRRRQSASTYS